MRDAMTLRLFAALVTRAGGPDAVASVLEKRFGVGNKGTVSRMCSGHIGVTVDAVMAVEDDLGAHPITEAMAARLAARPAKPAPCIRDMAARSVLAAGEAHAALIRAFAEAGDGGDRVTAREAAAIVEQMGALRDLADQIACHARRMIGGAA